MSKDILPLKIDPFRFAEQSLSLEGYLPINKMDRLAPNLYDQEGELSAEMDFARDEQGTPYVRGQLKVSLNLQCQRCMEPFKYEIITGFMFGFVSSEDEIEELPRCYDPIVVEEGVVKIGEILEEELLVSLPIVPVHNVSECKVTLPFEFQSKEDPQDTKQENPFKVVELLRSKRKND